MRSRLEHILKFAPFLLLRPTATHAYSQCYFPDGSEPKDFTFVECYTPSTASDAISHHAPCCVPASGDICQTNGLCYFPEKNSLYRGACTDPTWQDPACQAISLCTDSKPRNATWIYVQKCEGDEWQCGPVNPNTPAACNNKDEEFEEMWQTRTSTLQAPTAFTRLDSPSTAAITGTSTPAPAGTNSSKPLSKGAIAGIAIGAWAAFTFLGTLIYFCGRRGRGQASSASVDPSHGWEDDPWNQNRSGFGHGPAKTDDMHEGIHEIGIGGNTLVPIGLAMAAQNKSAGGSSLFGSVGSPSSAHHTPPIELALQEHSRAELDGGAERR